MSCLMCDRARIAAVTALALALPVAAADASTASSNGIRILYEAAAGEVNAVTVDGPVPTLGTADDFVIADAGADITAGPGCVALDAHAVRCTVQRELFPFTRRLFIDVGNRADEVDVRANEPPVVLGRQGQDRLTSANGSNGAIEGGPGDDVLTVTGGSHNNLCGGEGDDTLNGSPGHDHVIGGPGNDVLIGGSLDDPLSGGGECEFPGAGSGSDGVDTFFGGDGPDQFFAVDGLAEQVFCGPDVENGVHVDAIDVVADDCEQVHVAG